LEIDSTGRVALAEVTSSKLNDPSIEACMLEHMRQWQLPSAGEAFLILTLAMDPTSGVTIESYGVGER